MFINYAKGEIARMRVMLRAAEKGVLVSVPAVEGRYDLIVDDDGTISRVQVKYSDMKTSAASGSITVDLRKQTRGNGNTRPYLSSEVDLILVYLPSADEIVALTPDIFHGKTTVTLRYQDSKNKQRKGVHLVELLKW